MIIRKITCNSTGSVVWVSRIPGPNSSSNCPEDDRLSVALMRALLSQGVAFRKCDREYLEDAHERIERGLSLSRIQSEAIQAIIPLSTI